MWGCLELVAKLSGGETLINIEAGEGKDNNEVGAVGNNVLTKCVVALLLSV